LVFCLSICKAAKGYGRIGF